MKKLFVLLSLTFAIFSVACKNQDSKTIENSKQLNNVDFELKNRNLFTANSETTAGINNMISILNSFPKNADNEAFVELAENLNSEISIILNKCTMTGKAHDELHKFLVVIFEHIEIFESSKLNQSRKSFNALTTHLSKYKEIFKV